MPSFAASLFVALVAAASWSTAAGAAERADLTDVDALGARFVPGSIDSLERADAAIVATSGARARVEKDYKEAARECLKRVLVNRCLDDARDVQRRRLTRVTAVELEANRFKRADHAARLEADRAAKEAERAAKAPADEAQRSRSREAFEARQSQATRDATARGEAEARRSAAGPRKRPTTKPASPPLTDAQRSKSAAAYAAKQKEAAEHQAVIEHRVAAKAEDRKRRDAAKAAKEAKEAKAGPAVLPAMSGATN